MCMRMCVCVCVCVCLRESELGCALWATYLRTNVIIRKVQVGDAVFD